MTMLVTRTSKGFVLVWFAAIVGFVATCLAGPAAPQETHASAERGSTYFPLAVGNWWLYSLSGNPKEAGKTIRWSVTYRDQRQDFPVYYLLPTPPQGDDGPFTLSEVSGGVVDPNLELFVIKDPVHTGDRWSVRWPGPRFEGKLDTLEVVSAGKPCTVGGNSFDDCATIRESVEAINLVTLTTYARGVGPVKYVYFKGLHSKEIDTTLTIKSWKVH
jgi:hypothetical protein